LTSTKTGSDDALGGGGYEYEWFTPPFQKLKLFHTHSLRTAANSYMKFDKVTPLQWKQRLQIYMGRPHPWPIKKGANKESIFRYQFFNSNF